MKDKVEAFIAVAVVGVFCILTIMNRIDSAAFVGLAMYVSKKYLDGLKNGGSQ